MKSIIKLCFVIIGTVIGAGFASGQEITCFFSQYQSYSYLGILIAGIVFCTVSTAVLDIVYSNKIDTYNEFTDKIFEGGIFYRSIGKLLNKTLTLLFLGTYFIMVSGFGALLHQYLNINIFIGSALMAFFCRIIFLNDVKGIVNTNVWLTPIIIIGIFLLGMFNLKTVPVFNANSFGNALLGVWWNSALLYSAYNCILLISILSCLKQYINDKKSAIYTGMLGGAGLCILGFILNDILLKNYVQISRYELPTLILANKINDFMGLIYAGVLVCAIITSAVATGYCFLDNVRHKKDEKYRTIVEIMTIVAILISNVGFSNLVKIIYPIFGYIGILQIIAIVTYYIKQNVKKFI